MQTYIKYSSALAAALILSGCNLFTPKADIPRDLMGVWQTDGYGHIISASKNELKIYDATESFCQLNSEKSQIYTEVFRTPELMDLNLSADGSTLHLSGMFEPHETLLKKLQNLPEKCSTATDNSPNGNFDVFAEIFAQHYAFFDTYGVDWDEQVRTARSQLTEDHSDQDLFQLMSDMLAPLKDGHLGLNAKIDGETVEFEAYPGKTSEAITAKAQRVGKPRGEVGRGVLKSYWETIGKDILVGEGTEAGEGFIQYGITDGNIGYIAFATEFGYANREFLQQAKDLAVLEDTLDKAITQFKDADAAAVIIDLSVNFGGYDFISRAIAERFAAKRTLAYTKFASDAATKPPKVTTLFLTPSDRVQFTGPVYVITSDHTVSAGEILTMSLRALPNVTHVGEPTRGALSDVLEKTLPNGWTITLSNEVYKDSEGILWEGKGIEPHVFIENYDAENPTSTHTATVTEVIKLIRNKEQ